MTMTLIETKTLASTTAAVEFVSIPQSFTDLVLLVSSRTTSAAVVGSIELKFNSSSANFTGRRLWGSGNTAASDVASSIFGANGANATANTFGNALIYIPNYTASTNKSFSADGVGENNATESYMGLHAGLWSNTAAITSLSIGNNLVAGSTISLYGILKGSDGIVTTS